MTAALVVAGAALVGACICLFMSARIAQRIRAAQAELDSLRTSLERDRAAMADSIAAVHQSTVDEVTALVENLLVKIDTDIAATVAEALALQRQLSDPSRHRDVGSGPA